jgi:hypothetical protein
LGHQPPVILHRSNRFVVRRAPSTKTAVCSAVSFVPMVFLVFNKTAFCNYYYLVFGTLAATIATPDVAGTVSGARNRPPAG